MNISLNYKKNLNNYSEVVLFALLNINLINFILKNKLTDILFVREVRQRYLCYGEVEKHGDFVQRPDLRAGSSAHPYHSAVAPQGSVACCVPDLRAQAVCANRQPGIQLNNTSTFVAYTHSEYVFIF